jgi:hypothetical protein
VWAKDLLGTAVRQGRKGNCCTDGGMPSLCPLNVSFPSAFIRDTCLLISGIQDMES